MLLHCEKVAQLEFFWRPIVNTGWKHSCILNICHHISFLQFETQILLTMLKTLLRSTNPYIARIFSVVLVTEAERRELV